MRNFSQTRKQHIRMGFRCWQQRRHWQQRRCSVASNSVFELSEAGNVASFVNGFL